MKKYAKSLGMICVCLYFLGGAISFAAVNNDFAEFETKDHKEEKPKFHTQFGVRVTEALVRYEENFSITDTKSDWDAWLTRGDLLLNIYRETDSGNDMGIEVGFSLFRTSTEEEDWDIGENMEVDDKIVRVDKRENDTDFNGWELKIGLGYVHDLAHLWKLKHLVYYGHRIIEFDRRNFVLIDDSKNEYQDHIIADEQYNLDYIGYSPQITTERENGWFFSFKPGFAYVVHNEAYYDVTVTGEGGLMANAEVQLGYHFNKKVALYLGLLGEWQYLEGNTVMDDTSIVEWPDNNLYTYGATIGLNLDL